MIEVLIKFDDNGWHVGCEVTDAGADQIKGWENGKTFAGFEAAMLLALEEIFKHDGEALIRMTRGAAKAASRQIARTNA